MQQLFRKEWGLMWGWGVSFTYRNVFYLTACLVCTLKRVKWIKMKDLSHVLSETWLIGYRLAPQPATGFAWWGGGWWRVQCFNLCNEYGHANAVMDACHRTAELFTVCGTREVADRIRWSRCVISSLLLRAVTPQLRARQQTTREVCEAAGRSCWGTGGLMSSG